MQIEPLEPRRLLTANGLLGSYYDSPAMTHEVMYRTDANINFNWGTSAPNVELPADGFAVKWTGTITAPATQTYTFTTLADDGVRLIVNGVTIINRWQNVLPADANGDGTVDSPDFTILAKNYNTHQTTGAAAGDFNGDSVVNALDFNLLATTYGQTWAPKSNAGSISLTAGQPVNIELDYYDAVGPASVQLMWSSPDLRQQIVPTSALSSTPTTFTDPISPNGQDPWVIYSGGEYIYAHSTGGAIQIAQSLTLQGIGTATLKTVYKPPAGTLYSSDLWAPELHYEDGNWYIYFAADDGTNANHRMYVLRANSQNPAGTYTMLGEIHAATDNWAIDGTVLDLNGSRYFIWSGWPGTDPSGPQDLYIAAMSNAYTITGDRVMIAQPTYSWEKNGASIEEGPEILQNNGKTFLIYSASGYWTNNYCLGELNLTTGANPMLASSWTKLSTPVFQSDANAVGVGHASFVPSPDGTQEWIVYHAHNTTGTFTGTRDIRIQQFTWNLDDSPDFGSPVAPDDPLPEPSGTPHYT